MNSKDKVTEELQRLIERINENDSIPKLESLTSSKILRDTHPKTGKLAIKYDNILRRIDFRLEDYNFLQIYLDRREFSMPVHVTKSLSILDRDTIIEYMKQLRYNRIN